MNTLQSALKCYAICIRMVGVSFRDAKRGGVLSPGPQNLEGPFKYQNGYYLSVM